MHPLTLVPTEDLTGEAAEVHARELAAMRPHASRSPAALLAAAFLAGTGSGMLGLLQVAAAVRLAALDGARASKP